MIVTITMNPAVDKSTSTEKLTPEKKLRCAEMLVEGGGGGINVSKALKKLETDSLAVFPKGGLNGQSLENYLLAAGIPFKTIPIATETRENITVTETSTNSQFRFVLPGAPVSTDDARALLDMLRELTPRPTIIVASGSLPPGLPETFLGDLSILSKELGARYIVDTSGSALQHAAEQGVFLLKPNLAELSELSGKEELQLNEVEEAARIIIAKGYCEVVVISLGPSGALLITKDKCVNIPAPVVKKSSTVGAGDSMVAGMVWMLNKGGTLEQMAQFGVACGTAAVISPGTQLFEAADAFRLYDWIREHS